MWLPAKLCRNHTVVCDVPRDISGPCFIILGNFQALPCVRLTQLGEFCEGDRITATTPNVERPFCGPVYLLDLQFQQFVEIVNMKNISYLMAVAAESHIAELTSK